MSRTAEPALPVGLSTGIGHLPHCDPGEAVEFVLRHNPRLPAAPSLPARFRREGMVVQAAAGITGVTVHDDGSLSIDEAGMDPDVPLEDTSFSGEAYAGFCAFYRGGRPRRPDQGVGHRTGHPRPASRNFRRN